jgi:tetratricopeptide (TPR) repeat protein
VDGNAKPENRLRIKLCSKTYRTKTRSRLARNSIRTEKTLSQRMKFGRPSSPVRLLAQDYFDRALSLAVRAGVGSVQLRLLNLMGDVARADGNYHQAVRRYGACIEKLQELGHEVAPVYYANLGHALLNLSASERASECFHWGLLSSRQDNHPITFAVLLAGVAGILLARGQFAARVELASAAEVRFSTMQTRPISFPADQQDWEHILSEVKTMLGEETYLTAWNKGQDRSLEDATALAPQLV